MNFKLNNKLLIEGIEDLCIKRDDLHRLILEEEDEKRKLQVNIL